MAYVVDVGSVREALQTLPAEALVGLAAVIDVLELVPWSGDPLVDRNPGGAVRTMSFAGSGLVTYVVVEHLERVDLLQVHWAG
ncbi:hypothetical protein EV188_1195 [Actinomycetospora succinea]|uniref:mRNA-degrading endonuclease RelE of RelBE toxin-antitoxin system n=1 Tax=Actinomycetospora succinea TaxID=663603 RepID=A0A4R6UHS5_9PSEU|nr:hypothetical protein [Actinomycetospora succinea]TDQ45942.1 hypothetical protein EV188_1195 [Actinomycetospora succinea]